MPSPWGDLDVVQVAVGVWGVMGVVLWGVLRFWEGFSATAGSRADVTFWDVGRLIDWESNQLGRRLDSACLPFLCLSLTHTHTQTEMQCYSERVSCLNPRTESEKERKSRTREKKSGEGGRKGRRQWGGIKAKGWTDGRTDGWMDGWKEGGLQNNNSDPTQGTFTVSHI